jgi:LuxR family maltose regulon positive regulatory protein
MRNGADHSPPATLRRRLRTVERTAILERLESAPDTALVVITASAGYGKTTLMQQLAARAGQSAYVRMRPSHEDPAVLMQDIAVALSDVLSIPDDTVERILSPSLEPGLQAASRLAEAIGEPARPTLLLLDDMHVLQGRRAGDALDMFLDLLPEHLRVVAAGHDASVLHLARSRAAGRLIEVGETELSFDEDDTRELAEVLGVGLSEATLAALASEGQGWPVAVSLAMMSLVGEAGRSDTRAEALVKRSVADYIRVELLDPLDPYQRDWLLRSSVLETMSGPLCDHALEVTGSLGRLRELEHSSILVQAVDEEASRYRYHPLLRGLLREELDVSLPGEASAIAARAAMWCHEQHESLDALEYARVSEDRDLVASLMALNVWPLHWSGRIATLERWVDWFDRDGLRDRYASVAVLAGFIYTIDGRRHAGEMWLAAAEGSPDPGPMPDGSAAAAWVAMLRGFMIPRGLEVMAYDAKVAEEGMRGDSPFMPGVRLLSAVAVMLAGDQDEAARRVRDAVEMAEARGAMPGFAMAAGVEVALLLRAGQDRVARERVEYALDRLTAVGLVDYVLCGLLHAVAARVAASSRSTAKARHHLAHVHRLRPMMTAAAPWLSVAARLEAIDALIAVRDVAAGRTLMREVDDILLVRPELGALTTDAQAMRSRLERITEAGVGQWTLTTAELRVLQYLPTHLTFAEIADRLFVSPHTVKSQAVAIYSKLGVSSRRAAIETAVEFGLLDGSALRFPLGPGVEAGIG